MTKSTLRLILTLAIIAAPAAVLADPILQARCAADSIDPTAALQRIEWARKCGLITNTGGPNSFDLNKEYTEINPNRAYSSSLFDFGVNSTYANCRYVSPSIHTFAQDASGPTAGYWRWVATSVKSRPLYPIFETSPVAGGGTQLLPLPSLPNDCNLYLRDPTGALSPWGGNFYVVGYCTSP